MRVLLVAVVVCALLSFMFGTFVLERPRRVGRVGRGGGGSQRKFGGGAKGGAEGDTLDALEAAAAAAAAREDVSGNWEVEVSGVVEGADALEDEYLGRVLETCAIREGGRDEGEGWLEPVVGMGEGEKERWEKEKHLSASVVMEMYERIHGEMLDGGRRRVSLGCGRSSSITSDRSSDTSGNGRVVDANAQYLVWDGSVMDDGFATAVAVAVATSRILIVSQIGETLEGTTDPGIYVPKIRWDAGVCLGRWRPTWRVGTSVCSDGTICSLADVPTRAHSSSLRLVSHNAVLGWVSRFGITSLAGDDADDVVVLSPSTASSTLESHPDLVAKRRKVDCRADSIFWSLLEDPGWPRAVLEHVVRLSDAAKHVRVMCIASHCMSEISSQASLNNLPVEGSHSRRGRTTVFPSKSVGVYIAKSAEETSGARSTKRVDVVDALVSAFPEASTFVVFTQNQDAIEYLSRVIPFDVLVVDEEGLQAVATETGLDLSRGEDMDTFVFGSLFQSFSHVAALGCDDPMGYGRGMGRGGNAPHGNAVGTSDVSCSSLALLGRSPLFLPAI